MAATISSLSEKVVDDLFTENPTMFIQISKASYINALQNALIAIVDSDIELGRTTPDYESVMIRLMQSLSGIPEWSDLITAATGHAIIRSIASNVAYSQFSIERAYQETFISSASSDSGIFSGVRNLGLRPQRRQPARVNAQFTRGDASTFLTIPIYSTFTAANQKFFNRETIVFPVNVFTITAQLFQGVIVENVITSDGEPFQKYVVGAGESNASDIDVVVTIENVEWTRTTAGIHKFGREQLVYNENTAQNGDIELTFGNSEFGQIPPISDAINVMWVKTLGDDANTQTSGIGITWDDAPFGSNVTGTTLTNIENGAEAISSAIYKVIGPDLAAAKGAAVRRTDYKATALLFPGVYDALFRGQAELAPGRRSMMNVIGYTLLTDSNWTLTDFQNFEDQFQQNYGIWQCQFLRIPPIPIIENVTATIFCTPDADLQSVSDKLTTNITALFTPRPNYLGRSMMLADIGDVLNGRNATTPDEKLEQQVDYIELDPTMVSVIPDDPRQYLVLGTLSLTMKYTDRTGYTGKLTLAPNTGGDTTVIT